MREKKRSVDTIYMAILCLVGAALWVRAGYGFCWSDESFYLTFAQRLWNGQRLVLDEWHPVQFYSALTYPLLSLYRLARGTEGIYLFARQLYLLLAFACSVLVFRTFRKRTAPWAAFLCALTVLAYSRGNIWGLSYYNLFLLLVLAGFCLAWQERGSCRVLSGVFLGFSVLCVPYFAPFVVLALAVLVKRHQKAVGRVFLGLCLSAAYFLLLFLPKDWKGLLENLSCILADPEHQEGPLANLQVAVADVKLLFYWEAGVLAVSGLLLLGGAFVPKSWSFLPSLLVALGGSAVSLWRYRRGETGFSFYPYALFTLPGVVYCLFKEKRNHFGLSLQLVGMCMGLAMALSSNTEAFSLIIGVVVYSMGTLICLNESRRRDLRGFSALLFGVVLALTLNSRFTTVFRDGPLGDLDTQMTQGPAAGISTTRDHAGQYEEVLAMLRDLEERWGDDKPIFLSKQLPWGYLAVANPCGAPTAWRTPLDSPRLEQYYASHPGAIPEIVVVLNPEIGDYDAVWTPNENVTEGWLWDYMQTRRYTRLDYDCARVFVSPKV